MPVTRIRIGRLIAYVLVVASVGGGLFVARSARVFSDDDHSHLLDVAVIVLAATVVLALLTRAITGKCRYALLLGGAFQGGLAFAHPLSTHGYGPGFFGLTLMFASSAALGLGSWWLLERRV